MEGQVFGDGGGWRGRCLAVGVDGGAGVFTT